MYNRIGTEENTYTLLHINTLTLHTLVQSRYSIQSGCSFFNIHSHNSPTFPRQRINAVRVFVSVLGIYEKYYIIYVDENMGT